MSFWNKSKANNKQRNIDTTSSIRQDLAERFLEGYNAPARYASQRVGQAANAEFVYDSLSFCRQSVSENVGIRSAMLQIGSGVAAIKDIEAREYFKERFLEYCQLAPDNGLVLNSTDRLMYERAAQRYECEF